MDKKRESLIYFINNSSADEIKKFTDHVSESYKSSVFFIQLCEIINDK